MANLTHAANAPIKENVTNTDAAPSPQLKLLGLLLVVLGCVVINLNYHHRLDIICDDDDLYFSFGMMLLDGKYRGADDGPLYYGFQLLMQLWTNDAIETFYVNYIVTTTVPLVLFYLLLRALRINIWIAVWLTLMLMFSNFNYPLTPKLTHFAIIFLLLGLLAFTYAHGLVKKYFYCSIFTLLASYARPEIYIACLILATITCFLAFRQKRWGYALVLVGVILVCGYFLGTPIGARDRSFWTFKHHFSINYVEAHPQVNLSPWNHFNQITTYAFGHRLTSIKDAILTDPQLVIWHIKTNIERYATMLPEYFRNIIFDSIQFPFRKYVLLVLALAVLLQLNHSRSWERIKWTFKTNALFFGVFLIILIPTFISNFFIYPRPHYVLYHFFLYLTVAALVCNALAFKSSATGRGPVQQLLLSGANLFFIGIFFLPRYTANIKTKPLPAKDFALMLQHCNLQGPVSVLGGDAPFSYNRYVGRQWTFHYFDIIRPKVFAKCLTDYQVNCIIINNKMDAYFEKDPTYSAFLANPQRAGFVLIRRTDTHKIYAKRGLLPG